MTQRRSKRPPFPIEGAMSSGKRTRSAARGRDGVMSSQKRTRSGARAGKAATVAAGGDGRAAEGRAEERLGPGP